MVRINLNAINHQKRCFKDVPIKTHIKTILNKTTLSQFYNLQDFKNMIADDFDINPSKLQSKQLIKRFQTFCLKHFQLDEYISKQMLSVLWPQFISDNMDLRQVKQSIKVLIQQLNLKNDHFGYLVGYSFQNSRVKPKEQGQKYIKIIDIAYQLFNISKSQVNYSFYLRKLFNDYFKDIALQCLSEGNIDQKNINQQYSYYSKLKQKFNDIYCTLSMKFSFYYEHFPMSQMDLMQLINQCLKFIQNNYKSYVFETVIALFSINFIFMFIESNQKLIKPSDTLIYSIQWLIEQLMFLIYSQKYTSLMLFLTPEWITNKLFSKNLKGTIVSHLSLIFQMSERKLINSEVKQVYQARFVQVYNKHCQNIKLPKYTQQCPFFNQKFSDSIPKVNATWSNSYIGNKSFKNISNQNQKGSKTWDDNNEKLSSFNKQVNNFKSLLKQLNLHQICGRIYSLQKAYQESEQQSIKFNCKKDRFKQKYLFILLKIIATVSSQQKIKCRFSCQILAEYIQLQVMYILRTMYQEEFIFKEKIKQDYFNKILDLNSENLKINSIIQYAQDHLINCQFKTIYKIRQIKSNLNDNKFKARKNEHASIIQIAIIQILQVCLNYSKKQTQLLYFEYLKQFLLINNQQMELTLFLSVCFQCFKKYGNMQQLMKKIKIILVKLIYILVISNKGSQQCQYFILHLHTALKDFEHRELLNNFFQNTNVQISSKSKNKSLSQKQISPSLIFFDILRKQMTISSMLVIAKKYKQLNSIINAIFFYQLIGYRIRQERNIIATSIKNQQKEDKSINEQKRCQLEKKIKKQLLYCYSRVNTTFDSVKKVIGEQIGLSQNQMNFLSLIQKEQNYQGADIIQKYWTQTQKQYFQRKTFYMFQSANRKVQLQDEFYYNIMITKACPFFAQLLQYNQDIQCLKLCSSAMIVLLKIQFLKICIYRIDSVNDKQEIQKITLQERQHSIVVALQRLTQNIGKEKLIDLYKFLLLVRPQNEYLRIKYMNLLIQIGQYSMFLKEIEGLYDKKPYEQYKGSDLNLMVKYLYKIKNYEQCLMICLSNWIKSKTVNVLQIKIYQILASLQRNHSYSLQKACHTFQLCLLYQKQQKFLQTHNQKINNVKQKHIKYVKIFHLIFDRFSFQSMKQNSQFLKVINNYIINFQIFKYVELIQFAKEITFILLRYLIEKFWEYEDSSLLVSDKEKYSQLGQYIIGNFNGIVPFLKYHSEYLIRKISEQTDTSLKCNKIIRTFLRQIAIQNPNQSSWWLYSLINHQYLTKQNTEQIKKVKSNKKKAQQLPQTSQFTKIGNYIKEKLVEKKKYNIDNNAWINYFVQCTQISAAKSSIECNKISEQIITKLNSINHFLIMPFSPILKIVKIKHIQRLGQGKSCPLKIFIECQSLKKQETIFYQNNKIVTKQINKMFDRTIIMKYNKKQLGQSNQKNYMRQSNHANFFKQINLLGEDITYNIIHLARRLLIIQPIQYQYSLNELIQRQNQKEMSELDKIQKNQNFRNNSMKIYDLYNNNHKITLHRLFYEKVASVEEWWEKINNYSKTTAFWSYIGVCVGLGDRHGSNILINRKMKMIHIDFQYSLDCGLNLPYPEIVPFRLTKSVTSPMGLLRQYGIFYSYFIQAAKIMNFEREKQLWRALSYFNSKNKEDKVIMQRIELKNFKLSIQQGCLQWIKTATNPKLLRPMFIGWKGYL